MNYKSYKNSGKDLLNLCRYLDHIVMLGHIGSKILLSSPHGGSQTRLGRLKYSELGSMCVALELQKRTKSFLIAKTKNNLDDANFDLKSKYKDTIDDIIKIEKISYLVDFHGLAPYRDCDVNLGIYLGKNIETNTEIFDRLVSALRGAGLAVNIDQPFCGGAKTVAGSTKKKHPELWTIQIEINSAITTGAKNFNKCRMLISVLEDWLNTID